MMALSFRPFCPCGSRRVSLWYLSAGLRYTTHAGVCMHLRDNLKTQIRGRAYPTCHSRRLNKETPGRGLRGGPKGGDGQGCRPVGASKQIRDTLMPLAHLWCQANVKACEAGLREQELGARRYGRTCVTWFPTTEKAGEP